MTSKFCRIKVITLKIKDVSLTSELKDWDILSSWLIIKHDLFNASLNNVLKFTVICVNRNASFK